MILLRNTRIFELSKMTKRYRNLMGQSIMDIPVYFKLCKESIYQRTILQSPPEGSHEIYRVSDEIKY